MFVIGSHLSISKGYLNMGKEATKIGGNTFQYFTRNPRGGSMRALDVEDMNSLSAYMKEHNFGTLLAHAPYTYNPCAAKEDLRAFAKQSMMEDLERMEYLPGQMYNFHPGSHVKQGVDQGIEYIVECLNEILFPGMKTTVLLEVMAGKGTEIGSRFEEIARIIDGVKLKEYMGVCVDTCLKAIHLNDSKNPMGAHKDRHEKIGEGHIGIDAIARIVTHPKLTNLPFYLETPNELDGYAKEIAMLRSIVENQ